MVLERVFVLFCIVYRLYWIEIKFVILFSRPLRSFNLYREVYCLKSNSVKNGNFTSYIVSKLIYFFGVIFLIRSEMKSNKNKLEKIKFLK